MYIYDVSLKSSDNDVADKVVEKIKTHFPSSITFLRNPFHLSDNVKKCGGCKQAKDDNIIRHMRYTCWINKATYTHSDYVV